MYFLRLWIQGRARRLLTVMSALHEKQSKTALFKAARAVRAFGAALTLSEANGYINCLTQKAAQKAAGSMGNGQQIPVLLCMCSYADHAQAQTTHQLGNVVHR